MDENKIDPVGPGRRLALDPDAESIDPAVPAFIGRPEGASVYHGFPVVEGVEVEGFRLGMITDFAESPDSGDAYVIAPDGSRAGLVWEVGEKIEFQEVCPIEKQRWGVWAVEFRELMDSRDAMLRNLTQIMPQLHEKWQLWRKRYG